MNSSSDLKVVVTEIPARAVAGSFANRVYFPRADVDDHRRQPLMGKADEARSPDYKSIGVSHRVLRLLCSRTAIEISAMFLELDMDKVPTLSFKRSSAQPFETLACSDVSPTKVVYTDSF